MPIIETRFRDIPFDEAAKCAVPEVRDNVEHRKTWETEFRGKPIRILTPAVSPIAHIVVDNFLCEGPFFDIVGMRRGSVVCPHIAEIGD